MTSINSPYIFMETNVSNHKLLHFLSTQKILTRKVDLQSCFVMEIIDKYLYENVGKSQFQGRKNVPSYRLQISLEQMS